jgi:hypothetical protein
VLQVVCEPPEKRQPFLVGSLEQLFDGVVLSAQPEGSGDGREWRRLEVSDCHWAPGSPDHGALRFLLGHLDRRLFGDKPEAHRQPLPWRREP